MSNKVQFGLKNCYYAKATISGTSITYATPVAIPGAVNLNLAAQGENTKFFADDGVYFTSATATGFEGDLEVAKIPDAMLKDIYGYTEGTTSKVLADNANVEPAHFALLFEINGDAEAEKYVFYDCVAGRPAIASATTESGKNPQTQSISISAAPTAAGVSFRRTTSATPAQTKTGWYSAVFTSTT